MSIIDNNLNLSALPPWAEEIREKEAIANDPRVKEYLDKINAQITKIYKDSGLHYIVETSNPDYTIRVDVVYTHDEKLLQPKNFKLEVFAPEKIQISLSNLKQHFNMMISSKNP